MKLLCIDTSSNTESVSLTKQGQVVASLSQYRSRGHASGLLSDLDAIRQQAGWHWSDIDGVAVGLGPGGFTSLRIGLSTGKCLAYGLQIPLFSATSLVLLAADFDRAHVVPIIDAKRGEVYLDAPNAGLVCVTPDRLDYYLSPGIPYFFCGDGATKYQSTISAIFPQSDFNDDLERNAPQSHYLATIIDPEKPDELATLQPQYVRPSDAELTYPDGFPDAVTQFKL